MRDRVSFVDVVWRADRDSSRKRELGLHLLIGTAFRLALDAPQPNMRITAISWRNKIGMARIMRSKEDQRFLVDIKFIAACRSILPREFSWQSRGQIHISILSIQGGGRFVVPIPPHGTDAGPYRHAAQFPGWIVGRYLDRRVGLVKAPDQCRILAFPTSGVGF